MKAKTEIKMGERRRRPVIIDCDPGHDDAMAILWALSSEELDVKAVTTAAGNQTIQKVTDNALRVLEKAGRSDIPVAAGADRPLFRQFERGGELIHGESGLDGPGLPPAETEKSPKTALALMTEILEQSREPVTIVAIGPLTNVGVLLLSRPDLRERIEVISIMGGGTVGNWTPAAEFNIYVDPEAAKAVFSYGVPILMAGLDVTQKAYVTREENERLRAQKDAISVFAAELIDFYSRYHYEVEGFPGCTLHDPCAVAVLLHPELFEIKDCNVEIETAGTFTSGMTVIDAVGYQEKLFKKKPVHNAGVLFQVDREGFVEHFLEAMGRLGSLISQEVGGRKGSGEEDERS